MTQRVNAMDLSGVLGPLATQPELEGVNASDTTPKPSISRVARRSALRAAAARKSFARFVGEFWGVVAGAPLVSNRATTAICGALQDVADGTTTRLLIAIAPGTGKSTMLALYSAWRLARDPSWRSIHASHAFDLAATESRRVRRLIESPEYQACFPGVKLRQDESTVAHWATVKDGRYFAVGVDSALTGRRAHEAVLDDPLNAIDRFSKATREALWSWFTESLSTRLDNDRAPIVVVQQRLDRDDLIGRLVEAGGWTLLELPAESEDGELLAPNVLSREKLDALRSQIGAATYACQYLQKPMSDDAAGIKRTWWRFHHDRSVSPTTPRPAGCDTDAPSVITPSRFDRIVISVDMTFGTTTKTADYAVVQVWGSSSAGRYLLDQWRRRATQLEQREAIRALATKYPSAKVLIEKAAGGAGAIEQLQADGIPRIVPVTTGGRGKAERLDVVSPTIEGGNCYLPLGATWLGDFIEELAGATKHDDMQDALAYAIADLNTSSGAVWPEIRAQREHEERLATWQATPETERDPLPPPPPIPGWMKLAAAMSGGFVSQVWEPEVTGVVHAKCPQGHSWVDGRCRVCGCRG
jgi:predicted phage terminase large subunit-like protein